MSNLNLVETRVTIAGTPCHFVHLTLHQALNSHHSFSIKVDYNELDSLWMANPTKMIQLMGEDVGITMQHKVTGEVNLFSGIITNVSMSGQHGEQNYIIVSGCSPTIKLDGTPTMDSFTDLTLENIVQESIDNSGNGGEVDIKPVFKGKIDYIAQHNETCFGFLNRLSWLYGEWFGYDGTSCFFGKPDLGDAASITYDTEMTHFDFSASLIPPKVNRFDYLTHDVNEVNADAPKTVAGVRGYIKAALDESDKIYTSDAVRPLEASILTRKELDDLVEVDKYRMISQMLTMKGTTQTCKVKIAKLISVGLPGTMQVPLKHVETFLVTQVTHEADQDGTYFNTFTAIPSDMENIPMAPVKAPVALPQIAWVKSNTDDRERGRVKVEFQWQKKLNKTTNWIRVSTPDGGSSGNVPKNRGFVFIPEEGDQVMVNFENGDPNRPYVSASIFPENESKGGYANNHLKTIKTRSGHTIAFNDEESSLSISVKDRNGNIMHFDTVGKNITITAPETITMNAKNVRVNAEENITLSAGKDIQSSAGENMSDSAGETHTIQSKNKNVFVQEDVYIDIKKDMAMNVAANSKMFVSEDVNLTGGKIVVDATDADMFVNATGKITLKSGDIVDIAE